MNYLLLLNTHNLFRWVVLLSAAWVLLRVWRGFLGNRSWQRTDTFAALGFTTILNFHLVTGLILYYNSPNVKPIFDTFRYATSDYKNFFFTLLHPIVMILAALLSQVIYSMTRKAITDRKKFKIATLGYTCNIILILMMVPWPFLSYGRALFPALGN